MWRWYAIFCIAWAIFYALGIGFGIFLLTISEPPGFAALESDELLLVGLFFGLFALLALAYAAAPLLPRRPWAWVYGIVLIAFSCLGGCFFVGVPLLVFWVRPENREYFGHLPRRVAIALDPALAPASPAITSAMGGDRPPVWPWYVAFCAASALLFLAIGAVGLLSFFDPELAGDPVEDAAMTVFGFLLFPFFAVAPFFPRRPWSWTYGMAVIIAGMLACCTLPAAIPLLVIWLKPETKAAFGRR